MGQDRKIDDIAVVVKQNSEKRSGIAKREKQQRKRGKGRSELRLERWFEVES